MGQTLGHTPALDSVLEPPRPAPRTELPSHQAPPSLAAMGIPGSPLLSPCLPGGRGDMPSGKPLESGLREPRVSYDAAHLHKTPTGCPRPARPSADCASRRKLSKRLQGRKERGGGGGETDKIIHASQRQRCWRRGRHTAHTLFCRGRSAPGFPRASVPVSPREDLPNLRRNRSGPVLEGLTRKRNCAGAPPPPITRHKSTVGSSSLRSWHF